jgi:hypothetical protein
MAKIKGESIILYVHDGTLYRPVACLTSNSLETTRGIIESQSKCAPGIIEKQAGVFSYSISAEAFSTNTTASGDATKASHDYLLDVQMASAAVDWKLSTGIDGLNYFGNAIIETLGNENPTGDEFSTFSLTLNGNGTIVKVDPKA